MTAAIQSDGRQDHPGRWPVNREWDAFGGRFTAEEMDDVRDYILQLERERDELKQTLFHAQSSLLKEGMERDDAYKTAEVRRKAIETLKLEVETLRKVENRRKRGML